MINQCRFICFLLVIFLLEGSNSLMAQEALGKINWKAERKRYNVGHRSEIGENGEECLS